MRYMYLALLLIVFTSTVTKAQTVNGKDIQSLDAHYIRLIEVSKAFSGKVDVHLDYGQAGKVGKETEIRSESGKVLEFATAMGAVNLLSGLGFELVEVYTVSEGNGGVYFYVMKKKST